ncbi:MAG: UDP-3-O-(3-hydroxymyristoyl)glucosamine N-acyltransferase [Pseudomonadota bacterium]
MYRSAKPVQRTLADLAKSLGARLIGDGAFVVDGVAHPMAAESESILALAMDDGSLAALPGTKARTVAVAADADIDIGGFAGGLVVERPRYALANLLDIFARPPRAFEGTHASAVVEESARLASDVSVGAHVYVGPHAEIGRGTVLMPNVTVGAGARIGGNCLLHPGAKVGERVVLGDNVILQSNATIGADGFSYVTPDVGSVEAAKRTGKVTAQNFEIVRINSVGTVILGDGVEVGANTAIDRATLGVTRIGRGTKIDNLVQIAHNCTIGENCFIAGSVGIAGSVEIGDRVVLAGGVGIADHVTIGDDAIIMARSGLGSDVPAKGIFAGYPAVSRETKMAEVLNLRRLPRLVRDYISLKKRLSDLEKKIG